MPRLPEVDIEKQVATEMARRSERERAVFLRAGSDLTEHHHAMVRAIYGQNEDPRENWLSTCWASPPRVGL